MSLACHYNFPYQYILVNVNWAVGMVVGVAVGVVVGVAKGLVVGVAVGRPVGVGVVERGWLAKIMTNIGDTNSSFPS